MRDVTATAKTSYLNRLSTVCVLLLALALSSHAYAGIRSRNCLSTKAESGDANIRTGLQDGVIALELAGSLWFWKR